MHQQSWSLKNRRYFILCTACAFVIINFISCPKQYPITQDLVAPNWQNGETLQYDIIRDNQVIGKVRYTLFFDMDANMPVYILHLATNMKPDYRYFYDSSVVCFRRTDFSPVWTWQKVESDISYSVMTTRYRDNYADIWKETIDGTESIRVKYKPPCYDNDMVLTVLRGLRFKYRKKYNFDAIIPLTTQKISNTVRQMAKTTITTSSGTYECNKIQLRYRNNIYYIFYERNEPHRLIRYQEKNANTTLDLTAD